MLSEADRQRLRSEMAQIESESSVIKKIEKAVDLNWRVFYQDTDLSRMPMLFHMCVVVTKMNYAARIGYLDMIPNTLSKISPKRNGR